LIILPFAEMRDGLEAAQCLLATLALLALALRAVS